MDRRDRGTNWASRSITAIVIGYGSVADSSTNTRCGRRSPIKTNVLTEPHSESLHPRSSVYCHPPRRRRPADRLATESRRDRPPHLLPPPVLPRVSAASPPDYRSQGCHTAWLPVCSWVTLGITQPPARWSPVALTVPPRVMPNVTRSSVAGHRAHVLGVPSRPVAGHRPPTPMPRENQPPVDTAPPGSRSGSSATCWGSRRRR